MRIGRTLVGALAARALAVSAQAQGLGDAAKRESERRKAAQQRAAPSKSYDDQDLPSSQASSPAVEAPPENAADPNGEADTENGITRGGGAVSGSLLGKGRTVRAGAPASRSEASESSRSESYGNNPGSEASWRSAASGARRRVEDAEKRVQELDKKAASLMYAPTGDCNVGSSARIMTTEDLKNYKCVDPVAQWQGERQRTLDALDQAKADLEKARKDQETMQESARRQGALPGWLRE